MCKKSERFAFLQITDRWSLFTYDKNIFIFNDIVENDIDYILM